MSIHSICFHGEIRKISILLARKKASYQEYSLLRTFFFLHKNLSCGDSLAIVLVKRGYQVTVLFYLYFSSNTYVMTLWVLIIEASQQGTSNEYSQHIFSC